MKKRIVWLTAALTAFGLYASSEMVITSPTGLPDESDVVLEAAVDTVKAMPSDTVKAAGDLVYYTGDEVRNTAHGIKSAFDGPTDHETIRKEMMDETLGSWDSSSDLIFRSYKVSPEIIKALELKGIQQGAFLDVKPFFNGVDFPKGSSAWFQSEYGQLMARNTPEAMLQIENMLAQYHNAERDCKQVKIKAKFIEVSQSTLNQLGFTWQIEEATHLADQWQVNGPQGVFSAGLRTAAGAFGGTPASGSMVLTKTGWMPLRLAIDAIEQAGDSDVLSSPSVTTMDNKPAEIWVGEDRMVPQAFDVKTSDCNIHIEHTDWDSQLMGVHFEVTPKIQEGNLIRLALNPKIVDLIGYDTYQVVPKSSQLPFNGADAYHQRINGQYPIAHAPAAGITAAWDLLSATTSLVPGGPTDVNNHGTTYPSYSWTDKQRKADHETFGTKLPAIDGQMPYFRVREIETKVVVADGSTVGLGGLIYDRLETYKDKVPVLGSIPLVGRLFRSEGERSIKRNLMIFVSAAQLDNNGQGKTDVALNN